MTLAYSLVRKDSVQVLSDAAHYLPDGTLVDISSKIHVSPHIPLTAISVGSSAVGKVICDGIIELSEIGTFDLTITLAYEMIKGLEGHVPSGHDFAVFVSGISENRGPCHFVAFAAPPNPDFPAFALVYPGTNDLGNGVDVSPGELETLGITPEAVSRLGPDFLRVHGAKIAEAMRRKKMTNFMAPDRPPLHIIGGFVELTTITAEGCVTERLVTWPEDRIGRKIVPSQAASEIA